MHQVGDTNLPSLGISESVLARTLSLLSEVGSEGLREYEQVATPRALESQDGMV